MRSVAINARYAQRPVTGVERFAGEVSRRLLRDHENDISVCEIVPASERSGLKGHFWEQAILPCKIASDEILFSPCNTGPIAVSDQLVVIHDAAIWDCPDGFSNSFRRVYEWLLPALSKRCAVVATVSEFSRSRLAHHLKLDEEKIAVLGNAAAEQFVPLEREISAAPLRFLCTGSLDPRKNFAGVIEAWQLLKMNSSLPDGAVLEIVGGAAQSRFAGQELGDADGLRWLGRISDAELVARYQQADAFLFPSFYEGFGIPPLEAMACGCPVLAARSSSLPEVCGDEFNPADKVTNGAVLYFDPQSVPDIFAAMERFLALSPEQRAVMRKNGLARAAEFSWEAVAEKTANLLLAF